MTTALELNYRLPIWAKSEDSQDVLKRREASVQAYLGRVSPEQCGCHPSSVEVRRADCLLDAVLHIHSLTEFSQHIL